jgi:hypothetical protein
MIDLHFDNEIYMWILLDSMKKHKKYKRKPEYATSNPFIERFTCLKGVVWG